MKPVRFRCPKTGLNVQTLVSADSVEPGTHSFETIICNACAGIHLVNRETGQIAGERTDPNGRPPS